MALKIKFKGTHAVVRWNHPLEKEFYKMKMIELRDSDPKTHPPMYVKDESNKEIQRPKMPAQMVTKEQMTAKQTSPPIIIKKEEVKLLEENKPEICQKEDAKT